jgi:hypothetical protein
LNKAPQSEVTTAGAKKVMDFKIARLSQGLQRLLLPQEIFFFHRRQEVGNG